MQEYIMLHIIDWLEKNREEKFAPQELILEEYLPETHPEKEGPKGERGVKI